MHVILNKHFALDLELVGPYKSMFWASITWQEDEIDDIDDVSPDLGIASAFHKSVRDALSDVMVRIAERYHDHGTELSKLLSKETTTRTFYNVTYYDQWTKSIKTCIDTTWEDHSPKTFSIYSDGTMAYTPFEMDIIKREPISEEEAMRHIASMKYHKDDAMRAFEIVYGRKVDNWYELRRRYLDMPF